MANSREIFPCEKKIVTLVPNFAAVAFIALLAGTFIAS